MNKRPESTPSRIAERSGYVTQSRRIGASGVGVLARRWWVGLMAAPLILASCGVATASRPSAARARTPTTSAPTTTTTVPPPTTTTTTEQPGWTVVSTERPGIAVDQRTVTGPSGGLVTVVRFRSNRVRFDLHVGSQDPPANLATVPADRGPAVAPDEAPLLLAAFNGGFKMAAGAGGFEVQGQVLDPLVPGMASFVIDTNGVSHIGVWGQGLPSPGEQVASVRQNLPPLVVEGQPAPTSGVPADWGTTLGGGSAVARSAVGEDAQGNIIYVGGMSLVPADLAAALVSVGAVTGMELDINPYWIQLDAAPTGSGPMSAMIPGQNRPADQFQVGWTRDFFTVLATG